MKRTVEYDGNVYKVRSDKVAIPDFSALSRTEALLWLCQHTYARGYSRVTNPLAGLGDAIGVRVR